jgi:hypothetical protein
MPSQIATTPATSAPATPIASHSAFDDEATADGGGRESDCGEHADLLRPLLETDGKEQIGEQQRRDDEEEAEIEEVLAEVGGALRCRSCLAADVACAQPCRCWIDQLRIDARAARQPQRRHLAVARTPEALPLRDRDQRLRRGAVQIPVLFVLRTDALEIDRERRIPRGHIRRVADTGILGCQCLIAAHAVHRHHAGEGELTAAGLQTVLVGPEKVVERHRVADLRPQVLRGPLIQVKGSAIHSAIRDCREIDR